MKIDFQKARLQLERKIAEGQISVGNEKPGHIEVFVVPEKRSDAAGRFKTLLAKLNSPAKVKLSKMTTLAALSENAFTFILDVVAMQKSFGEVFEADSASLLRVIKWAYAHQEGENSVVYFSTFLEVLREVEGMPTCLTMNDPRKGKIKHFWTTLRHKLATKIKVEVRKRKPHPNESKFRLSPTARFSGWAHFKGS